MRRPQRVQSPSAAPRAPTPSFRSALEAARTKYNGASVVAHIERWLSSADDPVWHEIVTEALSDLAYTPPQDLIAANYGWIIHTGLIGKQAAERAATTGKDPLYEMDRTHHAHVLKLAESAEYLATEYVQRPDMRSRNLALLLEKEAVCFRELAAKVKPKSRIRISRQSGGKKRVRFRVYGAFMSFIINTMRQALGRPHYKAVVTMTNIAFPEADVTEDDVRSVWRAMACNVQPGDRDDALLFACGANASHGLPRSNSDKRKAVLALLTSEKWAHWSDREIARQCRVSHAFVAKLRPEQLETFPDASRGEEDQAARTLPVPATIPTDSSAMAQCRRRTVMRGGKSYSTA
jgi:hypothetical protein